MPETCGASHVKNLKERAIVTERHQLQRREQPGPEIRRMRGEPDAHLIGERGVSPHSIIAITFTNKAAGEMKERVATLVGNRARFMWVSTFHSACVRILRRHADKLGYRSSFTIYDEADAVRLTGYVLRDLDLDPKRFPPRAVHAAISNAKTGARRARPA